MYILYLICLLMTRTRCVTSTTTNLKALCPRLPGQQQKFYGVTHPGHFGQRWHVSFISSPALLSAFSLGETVTGSNLWSTRHRKEFISKQEYVFFEVDGKPCPGIKWPVWALLVKSTGMFVESRLNELLSGLENCRVVPVWTSTATQRRRKRRLQVKKFWDELHIPETQ